MFKTLWRGIGVCTTFFFLAVIQGTVLFFIWPVAIPAVFPGIVSAGYLAAKLAWWQSVTFAWVMNILVKNIKIKYS